MKFERLIQILIVASLGLLVAIVIGTMQERIVVAGDTAPNFSITTDRGQKMTRGNFGGKVLVLNFWATWCSPCLEEIPSLNEFQKQFANSGVVVLAVSVDKNEKSYRGFLERAGINFQTARDPESNLSAEYGTYKYPESYVIDRNGKVVQKIVGATNWTDPRMMNYIRTLL